MDAMIADMLHGGHRFWISNDYVPDPRADQQLSQDTCCSSRRFICRSHQPDDTQL